ncbi:altered inheritance of mitochondria protein 11 [Nadsonia fulvescens var. elongata DSM 6958]|uniref:Altered inheritance of mitochondria protein 11 n=1 Tax=Nadsonia fulvescens var. elongata DSM 6958 TaxID=857566 RepID=A0A1E3PI28_9ASCO|nr:altered inheritance of mitochondria protein 11 [Nadsonia fulvescens var. elongata DSM 6958]
MSESIKLNREEITARHRKQMLLFLGSSAVTLLTARMTQRGIISRRYTPSLFAANHMPPTFNFVKEAVSAVSHASILAISGFTTGIFAVAWVTDVKDLKEFAWMMKRALGGDKREEEQRNAEVSPEIKEIEEALESAFKK